MWGRTTSSFLPPRDLPSLNVPFCPPHMCGQPAQRCSVQREAVAAARPPQGPVEGEAGWPLPATVMLTWLPG